MEYIIVTIIFIAMWYFAIKSIGDDHEQEG